jgi:hypothetical protein
VSRDKVAETCAEFVLSGVVGGKPRNGRRK